MMGIGALAAVMAGLDELLGVVPGTAGVRHEDGHQNAGDESAAEHTAESGGAKDESAEKGSGDGDEAGDDHFLQSSFGGDGDAGLVVRLLGSGENAGSLSELTTDFFDHVVCCTTDGLHGERGEQEGQHTADEDTGDDRSVGQADAGKADGLRVGGEQSQGGQSGRTDGEALADSGGGVADGVELVSDLTDMRVEFGHFCDTAGVVGNGAVGVDRNGDTGGGQHTDSGKSDAVKACRRIGDEDADGDEQQRDGGGFHTDSKAGDDVGGRTGLGLLGDLLNGFVLVRSVVLGQSADGKTDEKAGKDCPERAKADEEHLAKDECADDGEACGDPFTDLQGEAGVGTLFAADEEGGDDGRDDTDGGKDERERYRAIGFVGDGGDDAGSGSDSTEGQGRDDGTDIRLVKVGTHAGDVADVIADVVSDNSRVTGVIFRDVVLDFTDEVGTDVSSFGVDTAADTGEESDGRSTKAETEQDVGAAGDGIDETDAKEAEADDGHTHDGTAGEGDGQGLVHAAGAGCVRSTDVRSGGDRHAEETGQDGEERTDDEA